MSTQMSASTYCAIGFIGAGRMGTALGEFMFQKNLTISGYVSRNPLHAQAAAERTCSIAFEKLEALLSASDCIGIATQDDAVHGAASEVARFISRWPSEARQRKTFFHMSGSLDLTVLSELEEIGCKVFSIHPLQSVATAEGAMEGLGKCWLALEKGSAEPEKLASLLSIIGRPVLEVAEGKKPLYHAAACIASNYLTSLIATAVDVMSLAGFERSEGLRALMPLVHGTLNNILELGPENALTGPIARGDVQTVQRHLAHLSDEEMIQRVYRTMGQRTLAMAEDRLSNQAEAIVLLSQLFKEGDLPIARLDSLGDE